MAVDNRPLSALLTIVAITFAYLVYSHFTAVSEVGNADAGSCSLDSDCPTIYCIRAPCPQNTCDQGRCVAGRIAGEVDPAAERVVVKERDGCVVGGCSSQLCSDSSDGPLMSTCEWRDLYACYQEFGVCERQDGGKCGWTQTEGLSQCLIEKSWLFFIALSSLRSAGSPCDP